MRRAPELQPVGEAASIERRAGGVAAFADGPRRRDPPGQRAGRAAGAAAARAGYRSGARRGAAGHSAGTVPALLAALEHSPGAIPAAPVADTLKRAATG